MHGVQLPGSASIPMLSWQLCAGGTWNYLPNSFHNVFIRKIHHEFHIAIRFKAVVNYRHHHPLTLPPPAAAASAAAAT